MARPRRFGWTKRASSASTAAGMNSTACAPSGSAYLPQPRPPSSSTLWSNAEAHRGVAGAASTNVELAVSSTQKSQETAVSGHSHRKPADVPRFVVHWLRGGRRQCAVPRTTAGTAGPCFNRASNRPGRHRLPHQGLGRTQSTAGTSAGAASGGRCVPSRPGSPSQPARHSAPRLRVDPGVSWSADRLTNAGRASRPGHQTPPAPRTDRLACCCAGHPATRARGQAPSASRRLCSSLRRVRVSSHRNQRFRLVHADPETTRIRVRIEHQQRVGAAAVRDAAAVLAARAERISSERPDARRRSRPAPARPSRRRRPARAAHAPRQVVDRVRREHEIAPARVSLPASVAGEVQRRHSLSSRPSRAQGRGGDLWRQVVRLAEYRRGVGHHDARIGHPRRWSVRKPAARQAPVIGTPARSAENRSPRPAASTPSSTSTTVSRSMPFALIGCLAKSPGSGPSTIETVGRASRCRGAAARPSSAPRNPRPTRRVAERLVCEALR